METVCFRIKIKKDSLDGVRKWFNTLKAREAEVLETLMNEKVIIESIFLEHVGNDYYLIYYMKAENLAYAKTVTQQSLLPIDLYHKECREAFCESSVKLEQLADFHRLQ